MDILRILSREQANQLSSVSLAFVGDAVQTLFVRQRLVEAHDCKGDALHKMATAWENCSAQAAVGDKIFAELSEDEKAVYLRGRNAQSAHRPKSGSAVEYKKATALEAVFGWLYLTGQTPRLCELLEKLNVN